MAKRYRVTLTAQEREALGGMISRGKADARKLAHARVLLQADASEGGPNWTDARIAEAVRVVCARSSGCGSALSRRDWRRRCGPGRAHGFTRASWTASRKRSWWRWPARSRPRARGAGRCGYWPSGWWNWR